MGPRKVKEKISQWAGNYLTYNRAEQRGVFVMSLLLLLVIVGQALIPAETFQKAPDITAFSAEIAAFETAWKRAADSDSLARLHRYSKFRTGSGGYQGGAAPFQAIAKPVIMVDLNTADTFDLQQLRGIGPAFARRIVNYRERLHGYYEPRQLLEVFGMDTARYALVRDNLEVSRDSVHRIDLNTVTFKELLHHPYFPFAVTKNIMIYRQKNKVFRSLEELRNIQGVSDSLFRRMVLYLRLGP
jgi:DNA uptake protein ComE-like DNA-binding protein